MDVTNNCLWRVSTWIRWDLALLHSPFQLLLIWQVQVSCWWCEVLIFWVWGSHAPEALGIHKANFLRYLPHTSLFCCDSPKHSTVSFVVLLVFELQNNSFDSHSLSRFFWKKFLPFFRPCISFIPTSSKMTPFCLPQKNDFYESLWLPKNSTWALVL